MGTRGHRSADVGELLAHVEDSVRKHALFRPREAILVAVSGGVDSIVLLDLLQRVAPQHGWRLTVAHFNHRLRGRSSDADERLVMHTARKLRLPAVVERGAVRPFSREQGLSLEMGARKLRHEFLARAAREHHCSSIALAHHADDQLELFFLRLLRGSGSEGLSGMRWSNPSPVRPGVRLCRPLLDQPKSRLYAYAAARELRFREDASNQTREVQRNRIRHELLPLLRKHYQPALDRTVLRLMELLGGESEVIRQAASGWLIARGRRKPFGKLPVAVQRACLQAQLVRLGVMPDFELVEQLRENPERPVCVGPGKSVRQAGGRICVQPIESVAFAPGCFALRLQGRGGEVKFGGASIAWQITAKAPNSGPAQEGVGQESFDAEKIGKSVRLRHWQPGDRFQPIGMGSAVKLQDFFTNAKVPRARRHELIVAETAGGEIFWVEGQRIGERFKLTPSTIRRLQWRWQRL